MASKTLLREWLDRLAPCVIRIHARIVNLRTTRLGLPPRVQSGFAILAAGVIVFGVSCRTGGRVEMPTSTMGQLLYSQHCAACHGDTGRGDGAAAIALGVRPRDFRNEPFRYVSTFNAVPTTEDLFQSIRSGRRFGEMPANPHLTDEEVTALADFVRELNRLGWASRLRDEFADDEDLTLDDIDEISHERVTPDEAVVVPLLPPGFRPDTAVGRQLYGASCASCHGPTGRGDGLEKPLDERDRPIAVRDLTTGEFRGGIDLANLFRRIRCGVPGTPMPSQEALTSDDIWQLVYYVKFLTGQRRYEAGS